MDHSPDVMLNYEVPRTFVVAPVARSLLAACLMTVLVAGLVSISGFSLMPSAAAQDRAGAAGTNAERGNGANRRDGGRAGARAGGPRGGGVAPNAGGAKRRPSDGGAGQGCPYRNQQLDLIV